MIPWSTSKNSNFAVEWRHWSDFLKWSETEPYWTIPSLKDAFINQKVSAAPQSPHPMSAPLSATIVKTEKVSMATEINQKANEATLIL